MTPTYADEALTLYTADCLEVMPTLPDASVDAVVTDPPYGLEFMGKEWDRLWNDGGDAFSADKAWGRRPAASRPRYNQNRKCRTCGKWDRDKTPCRCEAPDWETPRVPSMRNQIGFSHKMQAWHERWAREAFRLLKPGGHLLAFGGTRTYHRLASAIEDAGFEIRDCLVWAYASGFPKSLRVSSDLRFCQCAALPAGVAASDAHTALVRDEDGRTSMGELWASPDADAQSPNAPSEKRRPVDSRVGYPSDRGSDGEQPRLHEVADLASSQPPADARPRSHSAALGDDPSVLAPSSIRSSGDGNGHPSMRDSAARSGLGLPCPHCSKPIADGLGTALKPAWEPIVMARKPLQGTVAANVLRHGVGALNIDGTRIPGQPWQAHDASGLASVKFFTDGDAPVIHKEPHDAGRWPANVILTDPIFDGDTPGVVGGGETPRTGGLVAVDSNSAAFGGGRHNGNGAGDTGTYSRFFQLPRVIHAKHDDWWCECGQRLDDNERCPDEQGYARFYLVPKEARTGREPAVRGQLPLRDAPKFDGGDFVNPEWGSDSKRTQRENVHPTVKPLELMRHLVRLVTPPGGLVLDPFLGSGTTALAAIREGFRCIGIEREPEYVQITMARLHGTQAGMGL